MKVAVYDENLLWSVRLKKGIQALGHEAEVVSALPDDVTTADVAIVNLGSPGIPADRLVPLLRKAGQVVVAHAGHKEKDKIAEGKGLQCDLLVSNGTLTHRLEGVLQDAALIVKQD